MNKIEDYNNGTKSEELSKVETFFISVYCAWCKDYLYRITVEEKPKYENSHGICNKCLRTFF